jgi:hypothetical protein
VRLLEIRQGLGLAVNGRKPGDADAFKGQNLASRRKLIFPNPRIAAPANYR